MPAFTQTGSLLCEMPCLKTPRRVVLPPPGSARGDFAFHRDRDRELFLIMPRNHSLACQRTLNPRVALVGLSPAGNQIDGFLTEYAHSRDYEAAAAWASFRGLEKDILGMLQGLGITRSLQLNLDGAQTFAGHPEILTNSLVRCASLGLNGSSNDFDPTRYESNMRCVIHRLFGELTNPAHTRLQLVIVFGRKAVAALKTLRLPNQQSVWSGLESAGKQVIGLPHPSAQNMEYVNLASLSAADFPQREAYAIRMWEAYRVKPARRGRVKEHEVSYKAKRRRYWDEVAELRAEFFPADSNADC